MHLRWLASTHHPLATPISSQSSSCVFPVGIPVFYDGLHRLPQTSVLALLTPVLRVLMTYPSVQATQSREDSVYLTKLTEWRLSPLRCCEAICSEFYLSHKPLVS